MYPPETKCPVGYVINPSYSSSFLRLAVTAIAAAKEENIKNATAAFPILPVLGIETPLISVSAVFPEFDVFPSVPGTDGTLTFPLSLLPSDESVGISSSAALA